MSSVRRWYVASICRANGYITHRCRHLYRYSARDHWPFPDIVARHTDPMDEGQDPRRAQQIQYLGRFFPREQSDSQGLWKPSSTKSQLEVLPRDEGDEWNSKFSPFKGGSWTWLQLEIALYPERNGSRTYRSQYSDPVRRLQARSNLDSFLTFMLDRGATLDG